MIYPTIEQLTKGEFNRYELVVGVAKCARIVTDEYVEMKAKAQKMVENHETDKTVAALIDPEYKDQKAVKIAIAKLVDGRFKMHRPEDSNLLQSGDSALTELSDVAYLEIKDTAED